MRPAEKAFLSEVPSYSVSESIDDIKERFGLKKVVYLASNENPYGCSPSATNALVKALQDCHRYPDGGGLALKGLISQHLSVASNQVMLGNGSNEILDAVAKAYLGPGDELLVSEHSFSMYPIFAKCVGASVVAVAMRDWSVDLKGMLSAINAKTKVIVLANANNPTGTMLKQQNLVQFIESVPSHVLVVIDEAYVEFADESFGDAIPLLKRFENVVVCRTFSKAYGLAGFRIGYGISSPNVIATLEKLRQPFNINLMALLAAEHAIRDQAFLADVVHKNERERDRVSSELTNLGYQVLPSQTNFIACDYRSDALECYNYLLSQGVIVRPLKGYGMSSWLRVSIGTEEENTQFLACVKQFLEQRFD